MKYEKSEFSSQDRGWHSIGLEYSSNASKISRIISVSAPVDSVFTFSDSVYRYEKTK